MLLFAVVCNRNSYLLLFLFLKKPGKMKNYVAYNLVNIVLFLLSM